MERVVELLADARIRIGREEEMQDDIEAILIDAGLCYTREHVIDNNRFDFLVDGTVIECKVKGSRSLALEQMLRYAGIETVTSLILVTSKSKHLANMPTTLNGKPFTGLWLGGSHF